MYLGSGKAWSQLSLWRWKIFIGTCCQGEVAEEEQAKRAEALGKLFMKWWRCADELGIFTSFWIQNPEVAQSLTRKWRLVGADRPSWSHHNRHVKHVHAFHDVLVFMSRCPGVAIYHRGGEMLRWRPKTCRHDALVVLRTCVVDCHCSKCMSRRHVLKPKRPNGPCPATVSGDHRRDSPEDGGGKLPWDWNRAITCSFQYNKSLVEPSNLRNLSKFVVFQVQYHASERSWLDRDPCEWVVPSRSCAEDNWWRVVTTGTKSAKINQIPSLVDVMNVMDWFGRCHVKPCARWDYSQL